MAPLPGTPGIQPLLATSLSRRERPLFRGVAVWPSHILPLPGCLRDTRAQRVANAAGPLGSPGLPSPAAHPGSSSHHSPQTHGPLRSCPRAFAPDRSLCLSTGPSSPCLACCLLSSPSWLKCRLSEAAPPLGSGLSPSRLRHAATWWPAPVSGTGSRKQRPPPRCSLLCPLCPGQHWHLAPGGCPLNVRQVNSTKLALCSCSEPEAPARRCRGRALSCPRAALAPTFRL